MEDRETTEQVSSLRALAHPVRLQMLSLLTGAEMSASEVARELEISHANASYHLRVLAAAGQLVEAGEEKIRGGVAKKYRHPWQEAGSTKDPTVTDQDRELFIRATAEELVRRYAHRRKLGRSWLTDAEMWVDPEVWREVVGLVERASSLIHDEAKPPRSEGTVHVNMTASLFEMDAREEHA